MRRGGPDARPHFSIRRTPHVAKLVFLPLLLGSDLRFMKTMNLLQRTVAPDEMAIVTGNSRPPLNVAAVYQDSVTRDWAMQYSSRATRVTGNERVQNRCYDVNCLGDTEVLVNAVLAAVVADVIVVSIYAANELPVDLYVWFQAWMPRRLSRVGALTALIGVDEPLDARVHTLEYLQSVARMAQLDFIPKERKRSATVPTSRSPLLAEPADSAVPGFPELYGKRYDAYTIGV
jgi:hypothetical protein